MNQPAARLTLPRILLYSLLVFVVGVGGVLAGHFLRGSLSRPPGMTVLAAPQSLLEKGMDFPDVPLTLDDGRTPGARELLGEGGGVILFLDLECPPCGDMAQKWQTALALGIPAGLRVFAVTNHPPEAIQEFKHDYAIDFPVAQDAGRVYLNTYDVDRFPLEVVVGASGKIRATSYDATARVEPAGLARLLADTSP